MVWRIKLNVQPVQLDSFVKVVLFKPQTSAVQVTTATQGLTYQNSRALSVHRAISANRAPNFPQLVLMVYTHLEVPPWKAIVLHVLQVSTVFGTSTRHK